LVTAPESPVNHAGLSFWLLAELFIFTLFPKKFGRIFLTFARSFSGHFTLDN
jgi:uncharacterized RDD family membrane protein YckC